MKFTIFLMLLFFNDLGIKFILVSQIVHSCFFLIHSCFSLLWQRGSWLSLTSVWSLPWSVLLIWNPHSTPAGGLLTPLDSHLTSCRLHAPSHAPDPTRPVALLHVEADLTWPHQMGFGLNCFTEAERLSSFLYLRKGSRSNWTTYDKSTPMNQLKRKIYYCGGNKYIVSIIHIII